MYKYKILIADKINPIAKEILSLNNFEYDEITGLDEKELKNIIDKYDGIIIRTTTKVTPTLIQNCKRLKVIATASVGVDHIDEAAVKEAGITILNTPTAHTIPAAEHTIGLILMACRNTFDACRDLKNGIWQRDPYNGCELFGKKVGIVGVGRVGTQVAARLKSFRVNILGNDLVRSDDKTKVYDINYVNKTVLYEDSDIITFHVPLTELTENMIDSSTIKKFKDGVILINTARGRIFCAKDILKGLNSGKIKKVAMDVFEDEPPNFPDELINHPNVYVTPHIGAGTFEAKSRVAKDISDKVVRFFRKPDEIIGETENTDFY